MLRDRSRSISLIEGILIFLLALPVLAGTWEQVATTVPMPTNDATQMIGFGGQTWMMSNDPTDARGLWHTSDGANWSRVNPEPPFSEVSQFFQFGGNLCAAAFPDDNTLKVYRSADGLSWSDATTDLLPTTLTTVNHHDFAGMQEFRGELWLAWREGKTLRFDARTSSGAWTERHTETLWAEPAASTDLALMLVQGGRLWTFQSQSVVVSTQDGGYWDAFGTFSDMTWPDGRPWMMPFAGGLITHPESAFGKGYDQSMFFMPVPSKDPDRSDVKLPGPVFRGYEQDEAMFAMATHDVATTPGQRGIWKWNPSGAGLVTSEDYVESPVLPGHTFVFPVQICDGTPPVEVTLQNPPAGVHYDPVAHAILWENPGVNEFATDIGYGIAVKINPAPQPYLELDPTDATSGISSATQVLASWNLLPYVTGYRLELMRPDQSPFFTTELGPTVDHYQISGDVLDQTIVCRLTALYPDDRATFAPSSRAFYLDRTPPASTLSLVNPTTQSLDTLVVPMQLSMSDLRTEPGKVSIRFTNDESDPASWTAWSDFDLNSDGKLQWALRPNLNNTPQRITVQLQDQVGWVTTLRTPWLTAPTDRIRVTPSGAAGPIHSVASAVQMASDGTTIEVEPGTYPGGINFMGKDLVLKSMADTLPPEQRLACIRNTVLDGGYSVVTFGGGESANCRISGFTISHGSSPWPGGGINGAHTHATIENNIIAFNLARVNYSTAGGGGIAQADGTIRNNWIVFNGAGAAPYSPYNLAENIASGVLSGEPALASASAQSSPGSYGPPDPPKYDYSQNSGGGIYDCNGAVYNNVFYGNAAYVSPSAASSTLGENNIVWMNVNLSLPYGGLPTRLEDASDRDWNPMFVNPETLDFRLRANSPCIDAGVKVEGSDLDMLGQTRPHLISGNQVGDASGVDLGAVEFYSEPTSIWAYQFGGLPATVSAGYPTSFHWASSGASGTAVRFELYHNGSLVKDLGAFWDASGQGIATFTPPADLANGDYIIRMASTWDPTFNLEVGTMHVGPWDAAVPSTLWERYR